MCVRLSAGFVFDRDLCPAIHHSREVPYCYSIANIAPFTVPAQALPLKPGKVSYTANTPQNYIDIHSGPRINLVATKACTGTP